MNDDRWYGLIDRIKAQFKVTNDVEEGLERGPGKRHSVEFDSPMGRMRLERVTRPVVLERRAHYSKRAGSDTSEELVYAEGEFTQRVTLYRWQDGDWLEQDFRGLMD